MICRSRDCNATVAAHINYCNECLSTRFTPARADEERANHKRMWIEGRILGTLLSRTKRAGWNPDAILLDEGWEATKTPKDVRALFNDLDEIRLRFKNDAGRTHAVLLVRGNDGPDLIADWSYSDGNNFNETLEAISDHVMEVYG